MSNPLGAKVAVVQQEPAARVVMSVKFKEHGRTGNSNEAIREVYASASRSRDKKPHTLDDNDVRGVWVDGRILITYANILWVEYE